MATVAASANTVPSGGQLASAPHGKASSSFITAVAVERSPHSQPQTQAQHLAA